jgi:C1A family cysteine protease
MKFPKFYFLFIILLVFSCNNEPVDTSIFDEDIEEEGEETEEEEQEQEEGTFVDKDGNLFYLGVLCDQGSPAYSVGEHVLEDLEIPNDLPIDFDLSEFLPPVDSQGSMGSCTSWAISYYMKSMQEGIEDGITIRLSPAYTYNQISQGVCGGTDLAQTLEILKEQGVSSWNSFPYYDTDCTTQPDTAVNEEAATNKISDYFSLSGENMVNEMKTLLTQQTSIIISTTISDQFGRTDSSGDAAYRDHVVNYAETGCHAMLVVGYSDIKNAFKVVNSWGTDWGNNGFVWIDYMAFENVTDDTAAFRVINGAYVAYDE